MEIFIYGLKCPVANTIRYVGKSLYPEIRYGAHVESARSGRYSHHTARWIRTLLGDGLKPTLVILHRVIDGERWQDIERSFIASAKERGWRLTNSTAGGEGLDYLDPVDTEKYRANLSASMKELWNRPERREEARARSLKAWADPEITKRRLASMRASSSTPEYKAKMSEINREIGSRPEVKAAKSAKSKAYAADPVRFAGRLKAMSSDNTRAKMAASARAKWADADKKAAWKKATFTPEYLIQLSEKALSRATPEYRAMMAEKARQSWVKRKAI